MSDKAPLTKNTNFIRNQINNDLESKLHNSVHTRFPPEPNGYLHIGHAKSICLNFGTAKDYDGRCNLRFDDTNPAKENIEYVHSIKEDIQWLGFDWNGEAKFSSSYFDIFYKCAEELIIKGLAYVCFLSADEAREYRGTLKQPGKNSPDRDTSIEQNKALFKKMKEGEFKEGECVLRAKIDMSSSFMCMRDPTLYRIRFETHHQTNDDWCIYPMYDFAHCISDAIEGVTHSLCTLEFQDNRRIYDWLLEHLDEFNKIDRPHQYEFSRLNLEYATTSKRKLKLLVDSNHVSGWNDPRMPTISGLRRRGYTPESIRDFSERVGVSKVNSLTDISILESSIRDDLNATAPRSMAVINPIKLVIENYPNDEIESLQAPIHPQNEEMGTREIFFSREIYIDKEDFVEVPPNNKYKRLAINKEVRLRNSYVIKATRVDTDDAGNVKTVYCTYDPDSLGKNPADGRKVRGVIHFVELSRAIIAEFRIYDRLFLDPNPAKFDDLSTSINPNSLEIKNGFVEPNLSNAKAEKAYQFEREGYFCKDSESEGLVFNKTVGLRDTWNQ
ncbi:glutamine--tRNA ligase/YqeY domain fusion protein [Candidatus Thioglobus sp. NP1]|uniref:glutamine--tRNA ligase/YqeY domain fusion protein n=1 Tax=Candidatus Thioglobus sp. NP1 TaxID=2508687 RepID=UPI000DEDFF8C|nr:glutamine--tRNA ligase/YqeY domain fusion protein [Candidatus Thioglobus sp. NP1]AXE61659.1 glutamine--tRNA ligase [Candidatus Thioglobus sp. NP1]